MVNVASNLTKNERLKILFDGYVEKGIIPKLNEREYETQFKSFKRLRNKNMPYIYNNNHLYKLANSSPKQTQYLLSNKTKGYVVFKVPKKNGGIREINAPSKIIKSLQRWVLDHILYKFNCGDSAHGFVPNRTIYTNAEVHVNQDLVLGIDIKDFFPSIKFKPVYDIFKSAGYTNKMAWNLANLCTYNGKLPQGAPTSPMLSNLVALNLDNEFVKYCARWNFKYSRYADDITISGSYNLPIHKTKLVKIIENAGFTVNSDKTRMFSKGSSQKVTGLVVNDKVSIGRKRKKKIRAIVHNILKNGPEKENRKNDPFFKEKLFGHLGHAFSVEPEFTKPLISALKHIDWSKYEKSIRDIKENEININRIKRISNTFLIKYDELGFFDEIANVPSEEFSEKFMNQLNNLKEKCSTETHGIEACSDCLDVKNEIYNKCIKYILGHYTRTTGGHHHGHEIYDMKAATDFKGETIAVAFVMKAGKSDTNKESSLFTQAFDCTNYENIDLIAITSNYNLTNKLCERLEIMIRNHNKGKEKEQLYCLIMRNEMKKILFDFNNKIN